MQRSKDEVYAAVRWNLDGLMGDGLPGGEGGDAVSETIWMCDQMRAGQLYARKMFDTLEEAELFQQKMLEVEPDAMFDVKAVEARQVWN